MTNSHVIAAVVVLVLLVAGVGIIAVAAAIRTARQTRANQASDSIEQQGRYPEGHWLGVGMGMGIALGAGLDVPIGVASDNSLEQRHKDDIRPLTEEKQRRFAMVAGEATLVIGMLAFAAILLVRAQG